MFRQMQQGFTLVELMVVISIIGILAMMALPSYQDRIIKTQVRDGMALADFVKQGVATYYTRNQKMPNNNADAALPPADKIVGNFVTQVAMEQGAITITYGNRTNGFLSGKKLTLRPAVVEGYPAVPIAWVCGMAQTPNAMKIIGNNQTDIPLAHLPLDCAK